MTRSNRPLALVIVLTLAGCTGTVGTTVSPTTPSVPASVAPSSATPTPAVPTPAPTATTPKPTASSAPTKPPADDRKGRQLNSPYKVNGLPVVSKKHRITAAYAPLDPSGPYGLDAPAAAALAKMTAAARADGVRIRVHSGYRNWASQNSSYQRARRNYPQNLSFYAPAGASEHQTGLAVDLWDGVTWSLPMATTATGKWLFRHAHSYGFVLRYPNGKTRITGYHYEPWHYRFIGRKDALKFGNNSLTLEEYLGLT